MLGATAVEPLGKFVDEARIEERRNACHFHGFAPLQRLVVPTQPPCFRHDERVVDETLGVIQAALDS